MRLNAFAIAMLLDWAELVLSCPYPDVHSPDEWYAALAVLMAERAPA